MNKNSLGFVELTGQKGDFFFFSFWDRVLLAQAGLELTTELRLALNV
jgi:hypothetical protein